MRHVGDLPTQEQAQRFADYLFVHDLKVKIDREDGHWSIWAMEEDETEKVKEELARFSADPDDEEYQGHRSRANLRRKAEEQANRDFRKKHINVRTRWKSSGIGIRSGPMTLLLIGISVLVGIVTQLGYSRNEMFYGLLFEKWKFMDGQLYSTGLQAIQRGEIWRVFTPMFIHYGPIHLLFNMLWLRDLGAQIESRAGKWKYLLLVLAVAAISNFSQYFWSDWNGRHSLFGGMSGVVYGLFGYIWMKARYEPQERYLLSQQIVNLMIIWMLLCMTGLIGPVANAAHAMGLVAGIIFGYARTFHRRFLS